MNPFESSASLSMQGQFNSQDTHKYSVILPTYNERKNLPIIVWLLAKTFNEQYVFARIRRGVLSPTVSIAGWPGRSLSSTTRVRMVRRTSRNSWLLYTAKTRLCVTRRSGICSRTETSSASQTAGGQTRTWVREMHDFAGGLDC